MQNMVQIRKKKAFSLRPMFRSVPFFSFFLFRLLGSLGVESPRGGAIIYIIALITSPRHIFVPHLRHEFVAIQRPYSPCVLLWASCSCMLNSWWGM